MTKVPFNSVTNAECGDIFKQLQPAVSYQRRRRNRRQPQRLQASSTRRHQALPPTIFSAGCGSFFQIGTTVSPFNDPDFGGRRQYVCADNLSTGPTPPQDTHHRFGISNVDIFDLEPPAWRTRPSGQLHDNSITLT